jgi:hypothetical protein
MTIRNNSDGPQGPSSFLDRASQYRIARDDIFLTPTGSELEFELAEAAVTEIAG